ncbi:fimbria/pilus outer membrane usher protein [Serratia sp. UGAL515B_01]|uniref:fimbria/pilus outer membrane usher protein n=1 Tax=Serratia sp. UGAL515B_01 TaxID=2986763 RepID=UPI002954284C|nr:fimbria/pilus outer membrane usher protein [Serratia sp. UGAL515B_01]WON76481.1 fimbrial biogenesis outer membrane usher protein [Serratia sp. UGAL515B_01]
MADKQRPSRQRCIPLGGIMAVMLLGAVLEAHARDYFNPALLELEAPGQVPSDLHIFEEKGGQIPGKYLVDIYFNNEKIETRDVIFRNITDEMGKKTLQPCIPVNDLEKWGVLINKYPGLGLKGAACANLAAIPQSKSDFRFNQQQLLLSFPQSAINNAVRGWIDPKLWDEGINAVQLNYSLNAASSWAKNNTGDDSNNLYLNLRPGINIGAWRLRNYSTWIRTNSSHLGSYPESRWDNVYTYARRDIISLKSQLTLGDSTAASDIFDGISYRGVQLASDDEMLPSSLIGYAPVVRGIARSNAQVTVRQDGYVIYQTYISQGPFEINDMFPTGSSGDLYVTIRESDGSVQQMVVPFASLPVLQREGQYKYSVIAGTYRSYDANVQRTPLTQTSFVYGLPKEYTVFGGGQFSGHYRSLAVGIGKNLGDFGALSLDMVRAWSQQKYLNWENGHSFRTRYSKDFLMTGTNLAIAGYRYSTDGYWNMQQVLDSYTRGNSYPLHERRRNRAEVTIAQNLWRNAGSLALTAVWEDYWNNDRKMASYGASYSNSFNGISFGISYTYSKNAFSTSNSGVNSGKIYSSDQLFSFNVNVPLDKLQNSVSQHPIYASYMLNSSKNGTTNNNLSVGGALLQGGNLSWSVHQGYGSQGQRNSGGVNADWLASYGEVTGGYQYDTYSKRLDYGVQGGIVAHENGITFSQPLGETVVLVAAPGAKGVAVQGQTGVKTDFRGYTIVPYASPYSKNEVTLDTEMLGDNTDVELSTQSVIPTRGAIVKASYQVSVGNRVMMTLTRRDGTPVPFGSTVTTRKSKTTQGFIVGEWGQVYLTGLANSGTLLAKWGRNKNERCTAAYRVPDKFSGIVTISSECK